MDHDRSVEEQAPLQSSIDEPIPAHLNESRGGFNWRFMVAGMVLVGLIGGLMIYGMLTASSYYMTVDEVQAAFEKEPNASSNGNPSSSDLLARRIRVSGEVVDGSENWDPHEVTLQFAISDESGDASLPILFYGPRPDNFQRAASAIVEGELQPDGTFVADTLLLKCPSRYEEAPEEILVQANR